MFFRILKVIKQQTSSNLLYKIKRYSQNDLNA